LEIFLAGFNLDYETIREGAKNAVHPERLTPETLSAAYARISRSPLSIPELRRAAREEVADARKSNRKIVFDMGHSSIAEHAVFNLDILGVSRLAVETIERFRLCSYTEKSQRYVRLEGDYVLPEEIRRGGLEPAFRDLVNRQNGLYHRLYDRIRERLAASAPEGTAAAAVEGAAKEDARYVLSLATETQLGMTLNARNLELMIRRSAAHPLAELNDYGKKLYGAVIAAAPSLVRYVEPTAYDQEREKRIGDAVRAFTAPSPAEPREDERDGNAVLLDWTADGDERLTAFLFHTVSTESARACLGIARSLPPARREALVREALRDMKAHDTPPREFEHIELTYELVVSAGCFAQLKRHRMATLTAQPYDPGLGVTVPPSVVEAGMETPFRDLAEETERLFERALRRDPAAAPYVLMNAHRKRVLMKVNARELYHMSRLREDRHAQWDIRETVAAMVRLAEKKLPLTFLLAGGKDHFESLYKTRFPGS